jgi:hypothetical protein
MDAPMMSSPDGLLKYMCKHGFGKLWAPPWTGMTAAQARKRLICRDPVRAWIGLAV